MSATARSTISSTARISSRVRAKRATGRTCAPSSSASARSSGRWTTRSPTSRTTPASGIAGTTTSAKAGEMSVNLRELSQSLAFKFVVLLFIFMAVPLILYERFRAVDEEKNLLLVRSMQEEGRLIAVGMAPLLATFETKTANNAKDTFSKMSSGRGNVKLLFRPKSETNAGAFFYIAAAPPAPAEYLGQEMAEVVKTGILEVLRGTCPGG